MTMCLASATDALIPRMARQYTAEQVVESAVAAKLCQLVPNDRVLAAQAEASSLVGQGVALNTAIELACAAAVPVRAIHAANQAVSA